MASTFITNLVAELTVIETRTVTNVPAADSSSKKITHNGFNTVANLTATSSPAITQFAAFEVTLSGGAATIDLTSLTGTDGDTVDGTDLRVRFLMVHNKAANTGDLTISEGAAAGYDGLGNSFEKVLSPGGHTLIYAGASPGGSVISVSNKDIDLAGTGTEVMEVMVGLG